MNSTLLAAFCLSTFLFAPFISGSLLDQLLNIANNNPQPIDPSTQEDQDVVTERKQPAEVALILTANARCHGALISNKAILTAASCFQDENGNLKTDISSVKIGLNTQTKMVINEKILVQSVTINPSYRYQPDSGLHENDLAVVTLQTPAQMDGSTVSTIKLAPQFNARPDANTKLKTVSVIGWGASRETLDGGDSDSLGSSTALVMPHKQCAAAYGSVVLPNSVLCANITKGIPSTCEDDDVGASLRFQDARSKNQQVLIGIATKPIANACQDSLPSLFTNVASSIKWIKSLANKRENLLG
ncbi:trypsin-like protease [Cloeon dipterum]|uniref:trypsin-like protease n=1 Tax=Cloeon dipterum TaxID=197152 RepID=UPI00321F9C2C